MLLLMLALFCNINALTLNNNVFHKPKDVLEEYVCFTTECIQSASRIRAWMNETFDPCTDFHSYICGGFANVNDKDKRITSFTSLNHHILIQIGKILDEDPQDNELDAFKFAKKIFKKCVTEETQNELKSINNLIKSSLNLLGSIVHWPLLNGTLWDEGSWSWVNVMQKLRRMGLPYELLFKISLIRDQRDTSKILLKVIFKILLSIQIFI